MNLTTPTATSSEGSWPRLRPGSGAAALDGSAFDDVAERCGVGQCFDVFERIAGQHDEVGESPWRQRAELAWQADDLRAYRRGGPDDVNRGLDLGADHELLALVPV